MENFFNWMNRIIPKDEVVIWFNVHNMNYEKIELYGDIFKSLNYIILDTYLGNDIKETKIVLTTEEDESHFDWCWNKMIDNFKKENIKILKTGEHKNYLKDFFVDTFYRQKDVAVKESIPNFLIETFDIDKPFTKSDLDLLTELYKLMDKNIV